MDSLVRLVCGDGHTRTATDVLCVLTDSHKRPVYSSRWPKSPKQSTGRACMLSQRTSVLICVLMDSHGRPLCADGHTQTHTDTHGQPQTQPTWAKITRTVHGKGQHAESKDQRADMCTDGQPQMSCVCADGHTQTATDVLCVLTDTHGRPVCADGHPRMFPRTSCVCWWTTTDVMCVLNRQPKWAKITQTVHGKGQHAESKDQRADMCTDGQPRTACVHTRTATYVLCVLTDRHIRPACTDEQAQTATNILCVLADTHRRPVCTEQTAHVGQNHPNSPREGPAC
ncbi:unnamed protein product [Brassica rapa]|uniref:Uncharacterized protein n=1 Tax=Brassica campestris TaxID=3711 RepID=A0A8D9FYX1_BRACM|nr:unnamed protein product [Brassica rapa]